MTGSFTVRTSTTEFARRDCQNRGGNPEAPSGFRQPVIVSEYHDLSGLRGFSKGACQALDTGWVH